MPSVTYDKQAMTMAHRHLQSLKLGAYIPRLAQLVAAGGVKLTMDGFRAQRDPYGHAWKPLAKERTRDKHARLRAMAKGKKVRGQKILVNTARMRNSTTAIHQGRTGGVAIPTGYAASHQQGAHIPPHSRLKSYHNVTYRVGSRFASESQAKKAQKRGEHVTASRYNRTFANGIDIPQRMMLPDPQRGLPVPWQKMIKRETVGMLKRFAQKGAPS